MLVEKLIKIFVAEYECVYGVFFSLVCAASHFNFYMNLFHFFRRCHRNSSFALSTLRWVCACLHLWYSFLLEPFEFGAFLRPQFIKHKIFGADGRMGWLTGWLAGTYTPKKCFTLLDMLSKSPACIFSFTSYVQTPLFLHSWSYFLFILFWFGYLTLSVSLSRLGFVYLDHFLFLCSFYFII